MVGGVEIARQIGKLLQTATLTFSGYKRGIKQFIKILNEDIVLL